MTERFMTDDCGTLIDMHTRDTFDYVSDVVTLLNELHKENQSLQSRINDYDVALKTLQDLTERKLKENEQLKSEIEKLSYANEDLLSEKRNWQRMSDEYCKLSEENEQLKKQINELIKGIQDTAKLSADAICKPLNDKVWGKGDVE